MGKRELIALLNLSSWCLVMVERLFLAVPRGCLQFVIVVFPDHTDLLFLTGPLCFGQMCLFGVVIFSVSSRLFNAMFFMFTRISIVCFVCLFCCFTSQVNSYGHCGTVSSPNHTGLNKRLTSNLCTYFRL